MWPVAGATPAAALRTVRADPTSSSSILSRPADPVGASASSVTSAVDALSTPVVLQSLPVPPIVQQAGLVLALVFSVLIAVRLSETDWRALDRARRRRFLFGVPVGTLLTVGLVVGVYLFVQGGITDLNGPMVVPFRAYSYFYPVGILVSGFAHGSFGHLLGNMVGTVAFGTIAEYAWGHYPTRRGTMTFSSPLTNPYARVGAFVAGAVAVGVLTGAFSLGPVIGFSGVVFALAGFALTRYPLATVVATVADGVLSVLFSALRTPSYVAVGREQFVTPWFANVSLQGHALGLLVGVVLGAALARRRGAGPDGLRLWLGVVLFAVAQGLWALNVPLGGVRYRLFQAAGAVVVLLVAALLTGAVLAGDRPLLARIDLRWREAAVGMTVALLLAVAAVAVPFNLFTVADADAGLTPDNHVEVGDYRVAYVEDVPDQYVSSVTIGSATAINASGVVVISQARQIWWEEVPAARLAAAGQVGVRVGGVTWRETVVANRSGWAVAGNGSTYVVRLRHGDRRTLAYAADPLAADPVIAGRTVRVVPGSTFRVRVLVNGSTIGSAPIPRANATTTAAGLRFVRDGRTVYAVHPADARLVNRTVVGNATQVRIATREVQE